MVMNSDAYVTETISNEALAYVNVIFTVAGLEFLQQDLLIEVCELRKVVYFALYPRALDFEHGEWCAEYRHML
jgi:hypothetical protein